MMDKKIAVIGIGNPFRGDDGIGIHLMHMIKKENQTNNFDIIDGGTGGMNLFHIICSYDIVLLIDALDFGKSPGSYYFFSSQEIVQSKKESLDLSTHTSDVYHIIEMVHQLQSKPPQIFIFGIQPKQVELSNNFSDEIQRNIPALFDSLKKKIQYLQKF